jgi:aspartate aminotransferase
VYERQRPDSLDRGAVGLDIAPLRPGFTFEDEMSGTAHVTFSSNVERLQPSATMAVSALAKRLKAEGRNVIDLSAGEPDFPTPDWIAEAGVQAIRAGATRYTQAQGTPELRKAIASVLSARAGRTLDPAGVVVSCGAKHSLFNACFTLFGPGDEVLIAAPYWTSYPEIVTLARAESVFVSGSESRDLKVTPDDLEAASTDRTRGFIYSSPSNPTGTVYSLAELRGVAEWARDRGVWMIADEIYRPIYFGDDQEEAPGILDVPESSLGPFVLVDGASKAFAMTGWRIGFTWTEPEVANEMTALQSHVTSNPATPSQMAALAAYSNPERAAAAVAEMRKAFRRRRDLVTRLLGELLPEITYLTPQGAFYVFMRVDGVFPGHPTTATHFCSWLLEEAGVALVPGAAFGDDRYARMSYATSDEVLEDAIQRMAKAIRSR